MAKDFKVNKKYTHFAVRISDGKIVNGWETISDVESLKYYAKTDLEDMDLNPKDFKILSKKHLIKTGIDPFDWANWRNNPLTEVKAKNGMTTKSNPKGKQLTEIINGYLSGVLFTETDSNEESLDKNYSTSDFTPRTILEVTTMVRIYIHETKDAILKSGMENFTIGTDIWYTQSGQGAGFFDHSLDSDVEKRLTHNAKQLGSDLFTEVGEDGKIEIYGIRKKKPTFLGEFSGKDEFGKKMKTGGNIDAVYIEFLNKQKNFTKDRKYFKNYEEAKKWALKTFDKFDPDMIKYSYAKGGTTSKFTYTIGGL